MLFEWGSSRRSPYLHPDYFWQNGRILGAFIFDVDNRKLHVGEQVDDTHRDMIRQSGELQDRYLQFIQDPSSYTNNIYSLYAAMRNGAPTIDLLGRVGKLYDNDRIIASFWGSSPDVFDAGLTDCLIQLIDVELINHTDYLSTPYHGTIPVADVLGDVATTHEISPEEKEKYELYQKLHLMRGAEKQDAMQKLGLLGGGKPHPMQVALDKAGLRTAGQKWWAPQSEGFSKSLGLVLAEWGLSSKRELEIARRELEALKSKWLDPDQFWNNKGSTAFLYKPHKYYYGTGKDDYHAAMAMEHPELERRVSQLIMAKYGNDYLDDIKVRNALEEDFLVGRVGYYWLGETDKPMVVISFWNKNPEDYEKFDLAGCINNLQVNGKIPENHAVYVSTPVHKTVPVEEIGTAGINAVDDDEIELRKNLHLLRGAQKRDTMKKLGLGASKPHQVQAAMDKQGLRVPGQKWWAIGSEDLVKKLDEVLLEWEEWVRDFGEVYKNPGPYHTQAILQKYRALRGAVDLKTSDLYLWAEGLGEHYKIINDQLERDLREFATFSMTAGRQFPAQVIPHYGSIEDVVDNPNFMAAANLIKYEASGYG